jgi:DNA polymerase/3'-5' exonuclease PolX
MNLMDLTHSPEKHALYKGIVKLDAFPHRRLDILLVPMEELGSSLIYFTGNDLFNRRIRLVAKSKGMKLNQHGLFRKNEKIASKTEQEVFEALGLSWLEPKERTS